MDRRDVAAAPEWPDEPLPPGERRADPGATRHDVAEYALLGLLRAGACHGYPLAAAFAPQGWLRPILRLKMSQMYAYLHKLERQGWLRATLEHDEAPRPRRVFALTPQGEQVFDHWATQPVGATRDIRLEFLVKLAFAIERDPASAVALVARQREASSGWLARLRAQNGASDGTGPISTRGLIVGYRIRQSEAVLAWLDALRQQLNASGPTAEGVGD